jgi:hypothetical protein
MVQVHGNDIGQRQLVHIRHEVLGSVENEIVTDAGSSLFHSKSLIHPALINHIYAS